VSDSRPGASHFARAALARLRKKLAKARRKTKKSQKSKKPIAIPAPISKEHIL
jgi:hypothetical protein